MQPVMAAVLAADALFRGEMTQSPVDVVFAVHDKMATDSWKFCLLSAHAWHQSVHLSSKQSFNTAAASSDAAAQR